MCLAPVRLKDGTQVACRYCSLCRDNRINDLIGRCIAEQSTASATLALTLTYAGEVPEAALLRYEDVQKLFKRLRADGYSVRYIVAGEYGSKKGRAHWHAVLFFYGKVPEMLLDAQCYDWPYWPHGFTYFQEPDYKGFRYVLKYALKQVDDKGASKALSMSKKPPLGYQFFMDLADDLVKGGFTLHDPSYRFASVLDREGKPRTFWLQGRMREMFIDRYCELWAMKYKAHPPIAPWMNEHYFTDLKDWHRHLPNVHSDWQVPRFSPSKAEPVYFTYVPGTKWLIIARADGSASVYHGVQEWHLHDGNASADSVGALLSSKGLPRLLVKPVCQFLQERRKRYLSGDL